MGRKHLQISGRAWPALLSCGRISGGCWVWGGQGGAVTLIQLRNDCGFRRVVTGLQRKTGLCWRGVDYSRKVRSVWPRTARNRELLFP